MDSTVNPQPNINNPQRRAVDAQRAELERQSRDLYKVFNPTNQPFEVKLNMKINPEVWTIPEKQGDIYGELTVPKYVRDKYLEEMSQRIITIKTDRLVVAENEKRQGKGFDKMNLHTEQAQFESRNLKTLMSKSDEIVNILDGGLVKEYGLSSSTTPHIDTRQAKEEFEIAPEVLGETPKQPLNQQPKIIDHMDAYEANMRAQDPNPQGMQDPTQNNSIELLPSIVEEDEESISFKCGVCGKEFSTEAGLRGHNMSHKK